MPPLLLVLVDGLPHERLDRAKAPFLTGLSLSSVRPGMGFSCNIYPEMLAGRQPDDLGYLNKWTLAPDAGEIRVRTGAARAALDWATGWDPRVSRGGRILLERAMGHRRSLDNIPFRFLPYFRENDEKGIFAKPAYKTLFSQGEWQFFLGNRIRAEPGSRDEIALKNALEGMKAGSNVFVMFADVDAMGHKTGTGERFEQQIAAADGFCQRLVEAFRTLNGPDAPIAFFSDHGMKQVREDGRVVLDLEGMFGRASPSTFLYFLETVMLRLWFPDPTLREPILDHLRGLNVGRFLSGEERRQFGVKNKGFGEEIFLLEEGRVFYPSFFGGRFPRAVHGYHPAEPSQQAFLATDAPGPYPQGASEMYPFFQSLRGTGPAS